MRPWFRMPEVQVRVAVWACCELSYNRIVSPIASIFSSIIPRNQSFLKYYVAQSTFRWRRHQSRGSCALPENQDRCIIHIWPEELSNQKFLVKCSLRSLEHSTAHHSLLPTSNLGTWRSVLSIYTLMYITAHVQLRQSQPTVSGIWRIFFHEYLFWEIQSVHKNVFIIKRIESIKSR